MKYFKYLILTGLAAAAIAFMVVKLKANKEKLSAKPEIVVLKDVAVQTVTVKKGKIENSLSIMGTVFSDNDVEIFSETQGKITKIFADKGAFLPAGFVLANVDDELKRASLTTAEANLEKAKRDFERFESLFKQKATTEINVENARLQVKNLEANLIVAKRQLADSKITVPIAGILTERFINQGSMVQPGIKVGNLTDMSRLKVKVNVPEDDVFKLKNGDAIQLTTSVYPGAIFTGTVSYISPKGDAAHTYNVEAYISQIGSHPLKAGMFAKVNFTTAPKSDAFIIPRKALISSIKDPKVYVSENGKSSLRTLVVGGVKDDEIEVLSGLNEGEQVIVDGQVNLKDGTSISITK